MNRHISIATAIEKNKIQSGVAFIVLLEINVLDPATNTVKEIIRLADNSEDITYQDNIYMRRPFDFEVTYNAGSIPEVKIIIQDQTRAVQAAMQSYGGAVGSQVKMFLVNTADLTLAPEVSEVFLVTGASAKDFVASFTLGSESPLTLRFPRRKQFKDRCPWRYKGPECGYTGPLPTCSFRLDGTNGCSDHNNSERFGGFPSLLRQ